MKKKQNQKQTRSLKAQKKKAIDSRRKKANAQKSKTKKRSKAAKIVNSKKHNRRFSDKAPLILSPVIPEIASTESHPVLIPHDFGQKNVEPLLTHGALLSIVGRNMLISTNEQEFEQNMKIIEGALNEIEKGLIKNQESLNELTKIKIGQD